TIALKHISAPIPKLPLQYLTYQKVLDKLLAKDPEQRFQRGRDLIAAIDDLESNHRALSTTVTHPADLTVITLAKALVSATYNAVRWRWNKIRALRWSPNRGFYQRPATKITEFFFNEQHTPALTVRADIETKIHKAVNPPGTAFIRLSVSTLVLLVTWCGFSFWYAYNAPINKEPSFAGNLALATTQLFIDLPHNTTGEDGRMAT